MEGLRAGIVTIPPDFLTDAGADGKLQAEEPERSMNMKKELRRCWLICLLIVLALSVYPLMMGLKVLHSVLFFGSISTVDYPKYVIPYTPISLAAIAGVLVMPWFVRRTRRPVLTASLLALIVFFASEFALENVMVGSNTMAEWQTFLCIRPIEVFDPAVTASEATFTLRQPVLETEVGLLIGEYRPSIKLHFYMISVVLILGILSCCYGFARAAYTGDRRRIRLLIAQTTATTAFLALCVLACFTAFFRDGRLLVSPLSAGLMAAFFILLGVTAGLFAGNLRQGTSPVLPAAVASLVTFLMYLGEMALLNGHLYRFGTGLLFDGLGALVLSPADVLIILLAGAICWLLLRRLTQKAA